MLQKGMYIPTLVNILEPKLRYLGDTYSILSVEMLSEPYLMASVNIKKARGKKPRNKQ